MIYEPQFYANISANFSRVASDVEAVTGQGPEAVWWYSKRTCQLSARLGFLASAFDHLQTIALARNQPWALQRSADGPQRRTKTRLS